MFQLRIQVLRIRAKYPGRVEDVSANEIKIRTIQEVDGNDVEGDVVTYNLLKYVRSNQGTCYNQRPIVAKGDMVKKARSLLTVLPWKKVNLPLDVTSLLPL